MTEGKHVVIVGAGVIGLCSAYYAAQRGLRVTVIDRNPRERDGCSFGNAGMVVPSHFVPLAAPGMVALGLRWMWNPESPFYIRPRLSWDLATWAWQFWRASTAAHVSRSAPLIRDLSFASRACFEELSSLDFGLEKRGLLMLCRSEHGWEEEAKTAEMARQLGVPAEVLDAKQTAQLEPDIAMNIAGSVFFPKDCHLNPGRFMAELQLELGRRGVAFLWETEVTGWRHEASHLSAVHTTGGDVEADEFVVCGGSWSPEMTEGLRLRLPMQAGKGYSLTLPNPRIRPRTCAILTEARVAVTPMNGSLRFGGTMELAGLNEEINSRRVAGIIRAVPDYYPAYSAADFEGIKPWRGLRPCSPDGLPYLGRTAAYDNLVVATGHAMMGLSLGPITGRIVAALLAGESSGFDLRMLSPDRYA
jgi:D-amino-acid dehydrogenase